MQALFCSSPAALLRRVETDLASWPKMTGKGRNGIQKLRTLQFYDLKSYTIYTDADLRLQG